MNRKNNEVTAKLEKLHAFQGQQRKQYDFGVRHRSVKFDTKLYKEKNNRKKVKEKLKADVHMYNNMRKYNNCT